MDLSDFVLEKLRDDESVALFRASGSGQPQSYLVAAPGSRGPDKEAQMRLEQELALGDVLAPPWAAPPLRLAQLQGRTVLLLGDEGGRPLETPVTSPLDLDGFLAIAIELTAAVRHMHGQGIVHKDIRPANILLDASGRVRLTGFGFSSRTSSERHGPSAPDTIAGTLAYMAPEQTGRMNRSIDHRSDLYALGTTLYEMLVGVLPFSASDSMEWIHCHIARVPPPPSVRMEGIPPALDAVLLKLLAKNAEDRYQTAAGLEHDLRRCRQELASQGRINIFRPGERDVPERLLIPERLFGREGEVAQLVRLFDQVCVDGTFDLALIGGDPGVGKSAIVNELRTRLSWSPALFATAKFEQNKRDIPFATFARAFQTLIRQILGLEDAALAVWRANLLDALGSSAQLIIELIPDLALIIGPQPAAPVIATDEERQRFNYVFRQFIGVFARASHPLVLFLDDLQWLDGATLDLFEQLCVDDEIPYLFLVGAYRNGEVEAAAPVARALERIAAARAPLTQIGLTELEVDDVAQLVAASLLLEPDAARQLAELVHLKTRGNAFFVVQFLTALEADRLLWFDPDARCWQWDEAAIRSEAVTDNVAALMAGRLRRFHGVDLAVIKQLACLGDGVTAETIATALDLSADIVEEALRGFVAGNLVRQSELTYAFAHDGVQEAAYALISPEERAAMHLQAGRLLSQCGDPGMLEDRIFPIVGQYNRGAALIDTAEERIALAKLNLIAGNRAKATTAYDAAIDYCAIGCDLLPGDSWALHFRTTFDLHLQLADCKFISGDVDFAEQLLASLAGRAEDLSDLAAVVGKQMVLLTYMGRIDEAKNHGIACLARMGVVLSHEPGDGEVDREYGAMLERIGDRPIESFLDLPELADGHWRDAMDLLVELLGPAGSLSSNLLELTLLRMANISLEHGNCAASCHAYANVGSRIAAWRYGHFDMGMAMAQLAVRLIEDRGFDRYASRIYALVSGLVAPWSMPLRESFDIAFRAIDMPRERGGITYAGYAWVCGITALLDSGKELAEVERLAMTGLASAERSRFHLVVQLIHGQLCLVRALRHEGVSPSTFAGENISQPEHERALAGAPHLVHALLRYNIRKLQFLFYFGFLDECEALVRRIDRDFPPSPILLHTPVFEVVEYCFFSGLVRAARLSPGPDVSNHPDFAALTTNQSYLASWAERYPDNFVDRATLLAAEVARLEDRHLDAQRLYEEAAGQARQYGFVQNEALANELAARYYRERGFETIALAYLQQAHAAFMRWGADAKARQLEREHPLLFGAGARSVGGVSDAQMRHLDLAAIVEMYHALSGEILLDRLIERLMVSVIEVAGAVRGVLLLPRGEEMRIVAEASISEHSVAVDILPRSHPARGLPKSIVNFAVHGREAVMLADATEPNPYSADDYLIKARPRALLCLPLLKQSRLVGLLYLENNLAAHIFTPDRVAILQLLASQAAISIENAELFSDLQETQEQARRVGEDLRRSFDMIPALAWRASPRGKLEFVNKQWQDFTGLTAAAAKGMMWTSSFFADDHEKVAAKWQDLLAFDTSGEFEARMRRHDGEVRRFLVRAEPMRDEDGRVVSWHGTNTDIENLKRAEQAQEALARVSRITAMGELVVSIAHEVNQPLMAIVTNAATCLNWLSGEQPDIAEARTAAERIMRDGHRAGDVIASIRALAKKAASEPAVLDLRDVIVEVLALTRNELDQNAITVETDFGEGSVALADRVQVQQLILNLILNGVEAISAEGTQPRELRIVSRRAAGGFIEVIVADTGIGLERQDDSQIFEAFFTTKEHGIGIGLSICRSIVEAHRGRLWTSPNTPRGTAFHFTVPAADVAGEIS